MPPANKIAPQHHLQVAFVRVLSGQGAAEGPLELQLATRILRPNQAPSPWRSVWRGTLAEGEVLPLLEVEGDHLGFEIPSLAVDVEVRLRELDLRESDGTEQDTAIASFHLGTSLTYVQRILTLHLPERALAPVRTGPTAVVEVSILSSMSFPQQDS